MADEPQTVAPDNADPAASPAKPAEEPTPSEPTIESTLGIDTSAPEKSAPGEGVVDPNMAFQYTDDQGQARVATLGELVASHKGGGGPKLDEESLKKFNAFQKAMSGDANAIQELAATYGILGQNETPGQPAKQSLPTSTDPKVIEQVQNLQSEIDALKQQQVGANSMVSQLAHLKRRATVQQLVEQCKTQIPYTHKYEGGVDDVLARIQYYEQLCASQGIELSKHPENKRVIAQAFQDVENKYKSAAEAFSGFKPSAQDGNSNAAPGKAVDDQQAVESGRLPSRFQVVNGRLVDGQGRAVAQAPGGQILPSDPVNVTPGGANTVATSSGEQNQGPLTPEQFEQKMKAQLERRQAEAQG